MSNCCATTRERIADDLRHVATTVPDLPVEGKRSSGIWPRPVYKVANTAMLGVRAAAGNEHNTASATTIRLVFRVKVTEW